MSSFSLGNSPVDTLSKSNWRQTFTDLRLWLESRGLFYACQHKKETYCLITHYQDRVPTDIEILTASVAALLVKKDGESARADFEKSNILNHEWSIQWDKDESTLEREIISFNREVQAPGKSPEECFNLLKVLRRRYLLQRPEKKESFRNEDLFEYNVDRTFERFKARLVARGFTQQYGIDYTETFAPTVQMAIMRAFLSIIAAEDLECWQFDIKNAFTESKMKEVVYLKPPKGVQVTKGKSLRVLRSPYGLRQSARDWNSLLPSEMIK
ncbi:hypothetical protein EPUL_001447 [Erysiphe pulchra]|uniref:Reverse transcriptase Ty1/copia-type domain-containing protein n=1 Tax=Erysiphe pulchra TaxID=225359 RepID=A0A2S4PW21_9PEZI|nr:hypothetical protein EPUL_001447 [Erysiphe pulchra]